MLVLAASLFLTTPAPLDLPRAEAYLVKEEGVRRLEDRYCRADLWTSRAVLGRWYDGENRVFTLSRLDIAPPPVEAETTVTRLDYVSEQVTVGRRDLRQRRAAIDRLLPESVDLPEKGVPPRQLVPGFREIEYWQGTNRAVLACAFLPETAETWYLATWELAEGDDFDSFRARFEADFLGREWRAFAARCDAPAAGETEADCFRADTHHSVTNYETWRWLDCPTYTLLHDLPRVHAAFVANLTNEIVRLRAHYAAALPTPLDATNVVGLARLFATRDEYLATVGEEMSWSAACWRPDRRELVAYLPEGGEADLLKTFRHEAFHQYLSYATSMISVSPWLNEGYAQYFENPDSREWGLADDLSIEDVEKLARALPAIFPMDYAAFYEGTDRERLVKYRLAWSVAVFLEKGIAKIRFEPFKDLKKNYIEALLKTQDMKKATQAAFESADKVNLFVVEWKKFWLGK